MSNNYDFLFKCIVIGDTNVGKSCLSLKFTDDRYHEEHEATLGVEFASKNIKIDDYVIKIQIWDTAGQESFKSITRSYYKGSIAALIVFDITKRDSFENVSKWLHEISVNSHEKVQIVLIGNKNDLNEKQLFLDSCRREVRFEEGEQLAKKLGYEFTETSAKNGSQVEETFRNLTQKIIKRIEDGDINPDSESMYGLRRGKNRNGKASGNIPISNQKQNPLKDEKFCSC